MRWDCVESGHCLGAINTRKRTRKCVMCDAEIAANHTFNFDIFSIGTLERYPNGLFSGTDGHAIRKFLRLKEDDLMLHNWDDNCLYVYRISYTRQPKTAERFCSAPDSLSLTSCKKEQ